MRTWAVLGVLCLLAACSRPVAQNGGDQAVKVNLLKPPAAAAPADADASNAAAKPSAPPAPNPASSPMLAYSYDYGVEAPAAKVRALMATHQAACDAAGPSVCQVTGAEASEDGKDQVSAKLTFRAAPAWLKGYEDRLSGDAARAGGRLVKSAVTSDDLTRDIVDTDAAVKAKTALRDRLQAVLESRPGKVEDLLKVEEELATVQGDLDTTASELAVMRQRVATSDVTIEYDSAGVLAPQGVWSPVSNALVSATGILAGSLAAMIELLAGLAPWLLVVALIVWLFRKRLPKWGRAAPKPAAAPPAPPKQD
jgi:hypothetical protein